MRYTHTHKIIRTRRAANDDAKLLSTHCKQTSANTYIGTRSHTQQSLSTRTHTLAHTQILAETGTQNRVASKPYRTKRDAKNKFFRLFSHNAKREGNKTKRDKQGEHTHTHTHQLLLLYINRC